MQTRGGELGKMPGARRVECEGACEAARDWSATNGFLAVYPPFWTHRNESMDYAIRLCGRQRATCEHLSMARWKAQHARCTPHAVEQSTVRSASLRNAYVMTRTADDVTE